LAILDVTIGKAQSWDFLIISDDELINKPARYSIEKFEELLFKFVIKTDQSFQIVESEELRELIELLRPGTKTLSSDTIKRRVMDA
jgi:hypothetical protein